MARRRATKPDTNKDLTAQQVLTELRALIARCGSPQTELYGELLAEADRWRSAVSGPVSTGHRASNLSLQQVLEAIRSAIGNSDRAISERELLQELCSEAEGWEMRLKELGNEYDGG